MGVFREEASELLAALMRLLIGLEDPAADRSVLLGQVRAALHTLKGSSAMAGLPAVSTLVHRLESAVPKTAAAAPADLGPLVTRLLAALDRVDAFVTLGVQGVAVAPEDLQKAIDALEAPDGPAAPRAEEPAGPPPAPAPEASPEAARAGGEETSGAVRVSTDQLDHVLGEAEEMLGFGPRTRARVEALEGVHRMLEALRRSLGLEGVAAAARGGPLQSLADRLAGVAWELGGDADRLDGLGGALVEDLRELRMFPAAALFDAFQRPLRELAREHRKEVRLEVRGTEVRLDKRVIELVKAPVVHLLRNAVAHGIEEPAARRAAGKAPTGRVGVSAEQRGGHVAISVEDDGQGIDPRAVREAAVRQGLVDRAAADALGEAAVTELLFRPGFSTRGEASEVAGRGEGLAVVREALERLHGRVAVRSTPGAGTTFTLTVPLTLASTRGLLVALGPDAFALPVAEVERVALLPPEAVRPLQGLPTVDLGDGPIRLAPLAGLLGLSPPEPPRGALPVVILSCAAGRLAVSVEAITGEQAMIVKDLPRPLRSIDVLGGATVLNDGRVAPVLNPAGLFSRLSCAAPEAPVAARARARRILVVDDSATTRHLMAAELEGAGYGVRTAGDGAQALALLDAEPFDALVSDVNMPTMDGFELVRSLRADPRLASLPAVLVSAADAEADRLRGAEVGADAYVIKKDFVREAMLALLERLLARRSAP